MSLNQKIAKSVTHRPNIIIKEQLKLWVKAGGRCEFRGCNKYLYRDGLTLKETNYSEIAHIVAASRKGPRGDDLLPVSKRNWFDNLMLLCETHHKLIDSMEHQAEYSTTLLRSMKAEHEDRIDRVTGMLPENKTAVIRLRAKIGKDEVAIASGDIYEAIAPRYPDIRELDIDLTGLRGTDTKSYWQVGQETIKNEVQTFLSRGVGKNPISHISMFGFAPIPFLMLLGHSFGSKIPYEVYQKHRSTQDWGWKTRGKKADYSFSLLSKGEIKNRVGLLLSLSGTISRDDLPASVRAKFPLYEMTLRNTDPNPMFIKRREDLASFKKAFLNLLDQTRKQYPAHREVHIFPAIPMSVAIACGIERLPKVHSPFVIYDFNNSNSQFNKALTLR